MPTDENKLKKTIQDLKKIERQKISDIQQHLEQHEEIFRLMDRLFRKQQQEIAQLEKEISAHKVDPTSHES